MSPTSPTDQVVELLPLGGAVEIHAPFVKDEVEGGDVRVFFWVYSGQPPDVRGCQDSDYLLRVFDLAMFSSHSFLIRTLFLYDEYISAPSIPRPMTWCSVPGASKIHFICQ